MVQVRFGFHELRSLRLLTIDRSRSRSDNLAQHRKTHERNGKTARATAAALRAAGMDVFVPATPAGPSRPVRAARKKAQKVAQEAEFEPQVVLVEEDMDDEAERHFEVQDLQVDG